LQKRRYSAKEIYTLKEPTNFYFMHCFTRHYVHIIYNFMYTCACNIVCIVTVALSPPSYGVATGGRLLKMRSLLQKRRYSAKEIYTLIEPTNCSHPIAITYTNECLLLQFQCVGVCTNRTYILRTCACTLWLCLFLPVFTYTNECLVLRFKCACL